MHLAPLILKDIADSFLPVGMATLLEGEGELVLPAVPGFLRSHLQKAMCGISISKELIACKVLRNTDPSLVELFYQTKTVNTVI